MIFSTNYLNDEHSFFADQSFEEDPDLVAELCRLELRTIDKDKVLSLFNIDNSPEELVKIANILLEEDSSAKFTLSPIVNRFLPTEIYGFVCKHIANLSDKCAIALAQYVLPNVKLGFKKLSETIKEGENEITYNAIGIIPLPKGKNNYGRQWAAFLAKHYHFGNPLTEELCLCLHTSTDWVNDDADLLEDFSEELSTTEGKDISVFLFHHEPDNYPIAKALYQKDANLHKIWGAIKPIKASKIDLYNLWLSIDTPTKVYAFGEEYKSIVKKQITRTIEELKKLPSNDIKKCIEEDKLYPFRIAIYDSKYITTYDSTKHEKIFCQNLFCPVFDQNQHKGFYPTIHMIPGITWDDFNNHNKPTRFFRITDSSIWNYFAIDEEDFKRIVTNIHSNWEKKYYLLEIAHEFVDLNGRLTQESYLYQKSAGGHAADVSPFLFHSEHGLTLQNENDEKELKRKGRDKVLNYKDYKWRVLLVDDRIGISDNDEKSYLSPSEYGVSKDKIVKDRIEHLFDKKHICKCIKFTKDAKIKTIFHLDEGEDPNVMVLCVDTIEKAEEALKNYKFDFILLDYLLDKTKETDKERRYGYELLKDLNNTIGRDCSDLSSYQHYTDGNHYIVGPSHRYFFMFISAFTTAISERLRLSGWSRSEELWHIAEGACPTNTPELFCYNLQKMMIKRLKDSGIENLDSTNILKIMKDIYCREEGESSVRKRANDKYQRVLSLLYHYNRILEDTELGKNIFTINESVLMTSYIKQHQELGGLLEHIMHLVHLTAFGTARQWSEMWEEYLYFKNQFDTLFSAEDKEKLIELKNEKVKVEQVLQKLYGKIEEYILDLKKNN